MYQFPTVWVENSPETLLDIALRFCIKNKNICCKFDEFHDDFALQDDISLPVGICERMINISKTEMSCERFNNFINYFNDTTRTHIRHLDLSDSFIEDQALEILTKHSIVELDVSKCQRLTQKCLPYIAKLGNSLVSLNIGQSTQIFAVDEESDQEQINKNQDDIVWIRRMRLDYKNKASASPSVESDEYHEMFSMLHFPLLRKLVINGLKTKLNHFFGHILQSSNYLTYLDLSNCNLDCEDLEILASQKQLTSLILCDVMTVVQCVPAICQLKSLRYVIFCIDLLIYVIFN